MHVDDGAVATNIIVSGGSSSSGSSDGGGDEGGGAGDPDRVFPFYPGDPRNLREAQEQREDWPHWRSAIDAELKQLIDYGVFSVVDLPRGANVVGCRFVFRKKYGADGLFDKFKARLVAQGFSQREGVDFTECFAPAANITSVRVLIAMAAGRAFQCSS